MRRLLILMLLLASPAFAQRGGSASQTRAVAQTCSATSGTCPSNNYICKSGNSMWHCVSPNNWTQLNTDAAITCTGTDVYLDGEGNCDTISGTGDVTAVGDCASGDCFQSETSRFGFMAPNGGGVATFRALVEADISDLAHTTVGADHIDAITEIAAALKTGADLTLVTGTATTGECLQWDANGDAIGAGAACGSGSGLWTDNTTYIEPTDATDDVRAVSIQDNNGPGTDWSIDTSGDATFNTVTLAASATPGSDYKDSDMGGTPDVNAQVDVNCPTGTTAGGDEDCDLQLGVQGAGTMTNIFKLDTTDAGATTVQMGTPGTNYVNVTEAGAMTAVGSSTITATDTPQEYCSMYDSAGGTTIGTGQTVIPMGGTHVSCTANIATSANGFTINKTGTFLIRADCSAENNSGARNQFDCDIQENSGGGFADVAGSGCTGYMRGLTGTTDSSTCTTSLVLSVTSGDAFRLVALEVSSSTTTTSLAGHSRLVAVEID